jgi:hypothetical protein
MPRKRRQPRTKKLTPGVSRARYLKDDAFKNSRRAAAEFGHAAQCSVLVRRELMSMLEGLRQNDMHKRLTRAIAVLIREKRLSGAQRIRLNHLGWERLEGLPFNKEAGLVTLLFYKPVVKINTATGKVTITHPSFKTAEKVKSNQSVTHMRIIAGAAAIDFDRKKAGHDYSATDYFSSSSPEETPIELSLQLPAPVVCPVFIVLGFQSFKRERDQRFYEMPNRRFRALDLVYVHPAPPPAYKAKPRAAVKSPVALKTKPVKKKAAVAKKTAKKKTKR